MSPKVSWRLKSEILRHMVSFLGHFGRRYFSPPVADVTVEVDVKFAYGVVKGGVSSDEG